MQGLSGTLWLVCCRFGGVLVLGLGISRDIFGSFHCGFCPAIALAMIRRTVDVLEIPIFCESLIFWTVGHCLSGTPSESGVVGISSLCVRQLWMIGYW